MSVLTVGDCRAANAADLLIKQCNWPSFGRAFFYGDEATPPWTFVHQVGPVNRKIIQSYF
jgi:hypothetical protein